MLVLFLLAFAAWRSVAAQSATPYVPLSHWAMPYVEHLISAGVIVDPTPLTRPLKQRDVIRALAAVDTTTLSASVRSTIRRLLAEWRTAERGPQYRVEFTLGAQAANYTFRDPLELNRDTVGAAPRHRIDQRGFVNFGLEADLRFGPIVAVTHPVVNTRLKADPDWYGVVDNSTRFSEAYVSGQWRYAELFFGILDRNWGPSGVQGVLLSDNAYSLDHLALALGTPGVQLQAVVMQLDTRSDSTGALVNRFMEQHRLVIRPPGRWTLALSEATVISGVGRQLEPWYVNLATLSYFRSSNTGTNGNNFLGADVERRGGATLFGQFMLDDIQVSRNSASDLKPTSYAFTMGAKGRAGGSMATWMLFYTQVANLTYRNEDDLQVPLYHGLSTGRNFDDYDQATAKLSVLAAPTLLLEPELTVLRQGQGDPHEPHPLVPQYAATAVLFQGIVQRTVRVALGASWQLGGLSVVGNGGVHFTSNAGHIVGASSTQFVGSIGLTYRLHHDAPLP